MRFPTVFRQPLNVPVHPLRQTYLVPAYITLPLRTPVSPHALLAFRTQVHARIYPAAAPPYLYKHFAEEG